MSREQEQLEEFAHQRSLLDSEHPPHSPLLRSEYSEEEFGVLRNRVSLRCSRCDSSIEELFGHPVKRIPIL